MLKLTVLEQLENGNYLVNFNLDNEDLGNREVTYEWIRADIISNNKEVEYEFETDIEFEHIEIDEEEGEGFLYIITTLATEEGIMVLNEEQKVYKNYKRALTQGQKLAQQMDTILIVIN